MEQKGGTEKAESQTPAVDRLEIANCNGLRALIAEMKKTASIPVPENKRAEPYFCGLSFNRLLGLANFNFIANPSFWPGCRGISR